MDFSSILSFVSHAVGAIGVIVIVWGVASATVTTVRVEANALRGHPTTRGRILLRQQLGSSLLLGLEFLIAADVIRTVVQPTLEEVAVLGGIVAIRTVISYFLHKEMAGDLSAITEETRQ